jgi:hypothetical protein
VDGFKPRPPYPQGKIPGTPWIGGWVGPRAGLDAVVRRKIPKFYRELNPESSSPYHSAILLSYVGSLFDQYLAIYIVSAFQ